VQISPRQNVAAPAVGERSSVIVVDDSPLTAQSLARLLDASGYAPVVFSTGHSALDYAAANPPSAAAVVDVHLPDINGLVLSQKLRDRLGPDAPIIVLSGDTSMETLKSLPYVGATYFFSKPVNSGQLIDKLKMLGV
jgi:DNA-binding response OmpR family regulator